MNAIHTSSSASHKNDLTVTHVLAQLLERLEHSRVPVDAGQYRSVVEHLVNELGDVEASSALRALLDSHPAASELYENLNYQHAGLCRSALDVSLAAEQQAKTAIAHAMSQVPGVAANPSPTQPKEDPQHGKS